MMHFIVYDRVTGAILRAGGPVSPAEVGLQAVADRNEAVLAAGPDALVTVETAPGVHSATINVASVKAGLCDAIDVAAGAARLAHITAIPGQEETYRRKEAEARGWRREAPAGSAPFLEREASLSGLTLADLVAEVLTIADAWEGLAVEIEACRMSAKRAVMAATDIITMVDAAAIDWTAFSGKDV